MQLTYENVLKELCQYIIVDVLLLKIKNYMTFRDYFPGPGKWERPYTLTVYILMLKCFVANKYEAW